MNTILFALGSLQDEIDRVYALDVDAFRDCINALSLTDLVFLWKAVGHEALGRRLSEEIDPEVVSQVLERLPYSTKAESLKYMSNEQRLLVVETWSLQKNHDELRKLGNWQRSQEIEWHLGIADRYIKSSRLPMDRCASCGNCYDYWQSIDILDCMRHSSCEACLQEDGVCLHCDPSFG
jgi:hypothetical protein